MITKDKPLNINNFNFDTRFKIPLPGFMRL